MTTPDESWKCGDEFAPYHPQASHVDADWRDGWNACYRRAKAEISTLASQVEQQAARISELEAQVPLTDERDAKRYRWIASQQRNVHLTTDTQDFMLCNTMTRAETDAAIDAAIEQEAR